MRISWAGPDWSSVDSGGVASMRTSSGRSRRRCSLDRNAAGASSRARSFAWNEPEGLGRCRRRPVGSTSIRASRCSALPVQRRCRRRLSSDRNDRVGPGVDRAARCGPPGSTRAAAVVRSRGLAARGSILTGRVGLCRRLGPDGVAPARVARAGRVVSGSGGAGVRTIRSGGVGVGGDGAGQREPVGGAGGAADPGGRAGPCERDGPKAFTQEWSGGSCEMPGVFPGRARQTDDATGTTAFGARR